MHISRGRVEQTSNSRSNRHASSSAAWIRFNRRFESKCTASSTIERPSRQQGQQSSLSDLSQWLSKSSGQSPGTHINNLSMGDCEMQGYRGVFTVRGLVSEEGAMADDVLLSIPLSSCVQDRLCPPAYNGSGWNVNMAVFLLKELRSDSQSPWLEYLDSLPLLPPDVPLLMTMQEVNEIQYPQAMEGLQRYQLFALTSYETWQESDPSASSFSRADFSWALHMVQSRSIRLAVKGIRVMVPGIDLLNHGGSSSHGFLALSGSGTKGQSICFVAKKTIEKGAQVLWSYGDRSNCDFYVYHGFSLPANKDDDVSLFDSVSHLITWAEAQLGLDAISLDKDGLNDPAALSLILGSESNTAALGGHQSASIHASAAIQGTCSALLVSTKTISIILSNPFLESQGLEERAERAFRSNLASDLSLTRRLSAFRLHSNEWGTGDEKSVAPELVGTSSKVDVRIISVLSMLVDRANHVRSSSQNNLGFGLVSSLIKHRCRELLDAFPTTLAQDEALLLAEVTSPSRGTLDFRMGKKRVLMDMIDVFDAV